MLLQATDSLSLRNQAAGASRSHFISLFSGQFLRESKVLFSYVARLVSWRADVFYMDFHLMIFTTHSPPCYRDNISLLERSLSTVLSSLSLHGGEHRQHTHTNNRSVLSSFQNDWQKKGLFLRIWLFSIFSCILHSFSFKLVLTCSP